MELKKRDIVERLRHLHLSQSAKDLTDAICEIEQLRCERSAMTIEIESLKRALQLAQNKVERLEAEVKRLNNLLDEVDKVALLIRYTCKSCGAERLHDNHNETPEGELCFACDTYTQWVSPVENWRKANI